MNFLHPEVKLEINGRRKKNWKAPPKFENETMCFLDNPWAKDKITEYAHWHSL